MLKKEFRDPVGLHDSPQLQVSFHSLGPICPGKVGGKCPLLSWVHVGNSAPSHSPRRPAEDKEGRLGQSHLGPLVLHLSIFPVPKSQWKGLLHPVPTSLSPWHMVKLWWSPPSSRLQMTNGLCFWAAPLCRELQNSAWAQDSHKET